MSVELTETVIPENEPAKTVGSAGKQPFNPLILFSLILILPAMCICAFTQALPALDTANMSLQDVNLLRDNDEYVGLDNYERIADDPRFEDALPFTLRLTATRVIIWMFIPAMIGLLVGFQGWAAGGCNRILLTLAGLLAVPIAAALLWRFFVSPTFPFRNDDAALFEPPPDWILLVDLNGARNSLNLLDAFLTAAGAMAIGGAAYIAVVRGRQLAKSAVTAGLVVWAIGVLFALSSFAHHFNIPSTLTDGGPAGRTTTLSLLVYRNGLLFLELGYGSALALIGLLITLGIGVAIWGLVSVSNLRLRYVPYQPMFGQTSLLSCVSLPVIMLLGFPVVGLTLWGVWLVTSNGGFSPALDQLEWGRLLANTLVVPILTIWFVQVPVTYLVGFTLGYLRPLGRIGSAFLFLPLFVFALLPTEVLMLSWFRRAADADALDTRAILALPWLIGAFSLLIFKLYFDGAHEAMQEAREKDENANVFMQVILPSVPVVLLVAFFLSFLTSQDYIWSLIAVRSPDLFTVPVELRVIFGAFATEGSLLAGAGVFYAVLMAGLFFIPFAVLQIGLLERMALIAGPTAAEERAQIVKSQKVETLEATPVSPEPAASESDSHEETFVGTRGPEDGMPPQPNVKRSTDEVNILRTEPSTMVPEDEDIDQDDHAATIIGTRDTAEEMPSSPSVKRSTDEVDILRTDAPTVFPQDQDADEDDKPEKPE